MTGDRAEARRPLASRQSRWAGAAARRLARTSVTPDRISQASMVFALLGGGALALSAGADGAGRAALLILGALGCQLRLLCNLLDGMVAIEGGKSGAEGPFWNEVPDRVSDVLILVGAGIGAGLPALGWAAAALAVGTAYLREMGRAEGQPADYRGPMAKPHRMAAITLGALAGLAVPWLPLAADALALALWIVLAGSLVTLWRRAARLLAGLRRR